MCLVLPFMLRFLDNWQLWAATATALIPSQWHKWGNWAEYSNRVSKWEMSIIGLLHKTEKIPLHLLTISMTSAVVGMAIVTTETGPRTTNVARWIAKLTNLPIQCHFLKRIILFLMARRARTLFQHPIKGSYNWNPVWIFRFQSLIKTHWNSPVQYRLGNRCVLTSRNNKEYYNRCATQPMAKHCDVQRICMVVTHTQIFSDLYMSASLLTKPEH